MSTERDSNTATQPAADKRRTGGMDMNTDNKEIKNQLVVGYDG